jgi:protein arginine N-methyltransferase 5
MLTAPITTPAFQSRVLSLLSSHLSNLEAPSPDVSGTMGTSENTRSLSIPPLTVADSDLTPNESMSNVVAVSSSWIDLCSPDPLIANISRQVLLLEVAYAAFCGVSYVVIPGPRLHHDGLHAEGVPYFARAIQEAMSTAPYIHMHVWLRMIDNPDLESTEMGDLAPFARADCVREWPPTGPSRVDLFGTWDAWNVIRTVCKYHSRLLVGKNCNLSNPPLPSVLNTMAL